MDLLQPRLALIVAFATLATLLPLAGTTPAVAAPSVVAFDMVDSGSQNLVSYTDDPSIPFTSAGDGFNKFQRGVSPSIPFAVADDSLSIYTPDNQGIIKEGNTDVFFGVVDTNNGDTGGADVTATWVFDVAGASNLSLSIDIGAMGDFEADDTFTWVAPATLRYINLGQTEITGIHPEVLLNGKVRIEVVCLRNDAYATANGPGLGGHGKTKYAEFPAVRPGKA